MKKNSSRSAAASKTALAALIILLTASIAVGVVYARYRARVNSAAQIEMEYAFEPDSIYLLANSVDENGLTTGRPVTAEGSEIYSSPGDWSLVANDGSVYQIDMLLSNEKQIGHPAAYGQTAYIEVFATAGIPGADDLIIQLETESGSYVASGTEVTQDTPMFQAYGPGWVYTFSNASGEPITWTMAGGVSAMIPVKITAWGQFDYPGALTVIAAGIPD